MEGISLWNKKRWGFLDAISFGELAVGRGIKGFIGDAFAVEKQLRGLAVRAGWGGEEEELGDFWSFGFLRMFAGAVVTFFAYWMLVIGINVGLPHLEFLDFTGIPVLDWTIITGDTGIDFGFLSAMWALPLLANEIPVLGANGIGWGHGVIRKFVVLGDLADELHAGFPIWEALTKEGVEDGSGGIKGLELILDIKSGEDVFGIANRKVAGVGVIWGFSSFGGADDVWIPGLVVLSKTEGGGFRWGCLEVIEVTIFLLVVGELFPHVVEDLNGEVLCFFMGEVSF